MTTYRVDLKEFADFIEGLPDDHPDKDFFIDVFDEKTVKPLTFLSESGLPDDEEIDGRDSFSVFLYEHGLRAAYDGPGEPVALEYDPEAAKAIRKECHKIIKELDVEGDAPRSERMPTWEKFCLSGDDDVDYFGGYILIGLDMLDDFLKVKYGVAIPQYEAWSEGEPYVR
jgi:hypothetical protein